jgi:hypothetical protein
MADAQLESEIGKLKSQFPEQGWDTLDGQGQTLMQRVLKHAYDNEFPNIQAAYRDLQWDAHVTSAKAEALKQQSAQQIAANKAGIVSGGAPRPQPSNGGLQYQPGDDYKTLTQKALATVGG